MFSKCLTILILLSATFATVNSNNVTIKRVRRNNGACGIPSQSTSLIIWGNDFPQGAWPWMVALMQKKTSPPSYFCGGVLVSRTKVLTAAHCIQNKDQRTRKLPRDILLLFGAFDLSDLFQSDILFRSPLKIFIHPEWNPFNQRHDADIAALTTEDEIPYTKYIRPICLAQTELMAIEGYVAGWGESEDRSKVHENLPKQIKIPIHANEFCFLESVEFTKISSLRTFCGGARNMTGPCKGDSGSGVFVRVGNTFYLKGLVSASLTILGECDVTNFALYTNVDKFIDWIKEPTEELSVATYEDDKACGIPSQITSLIIRGNDFQRGAWPWMVALMTKKTSPPSFFCGGVLVSSTKVLTAAHCIQDKNQRSRKLPRDILLLLGAYDLNDLFQTGAFSKSPSNILIHPDWNPFNQRHDADIAALLIEDEIPYTKYVRPICLFRTDLTAKEGYVTGWGESEDRSKVHENLPKQIKIMIHTNEGCFLENDEFAKIASKRTFCGVTRNMSGPRRGDSGGGFFVEVDKTFYLKGLVLTALTDDLALYTNVGKFIDWIEQPTEELSVATQPTT